MIGTVYNKRRRKYEPIEVPADEHTQEERARLAARLRRAEKQEKVQAKLDNSGGVCRHCHTVKSISGYCEC